MAEPTTWQQRTTPLTLTSITSSNEASGYVSNGPTSSGGASGGESSAALFTSRFGAPHSATTSAVAASIDDRSVTSTE